MIWLDLLAAIIIVGAMAIETTRDFGSTLFDMLAVLTSVTIAKLLGPALAHAVKFLPGADHNLAFWMVFTWVVSAAALLVLAKVVQDVMLLTLDSFDSFLGLVFGFVSGLATAHIILLIMLTGNPANTDWGATARKDFAVRQVVYFDGYHSVFNWLKQAGQGD